MRSAPDSRLALLGRLAGVCLVLLLAVTTASAYLRLANSGLGCDDWPRCYGRMATADPAGKAGGIEIVRLVHRFSATSSLLLALALAGLCWLRRPVLAREGIVSALLLAASLGLAILGWITGASQHPAVVLANLMGGCSMVMLAAWLLDSAAVPTGGAKPRMKPSLRLWAWFGLLLLVLEILLGGLIGANFAALSCTTLPVCEMGGSGGAALHLSHRAVALLAALVLGAAGLRAASGPGGTIALAIPALILGEILLGLASVRFGLPLLLVVAHNFVAVLLLAATATLLRRLA